MSLSWIKNAPLLRTRFGVPEIGGAQGMKRVLKKLRMNHSDKKTNTSSNLAIIFEQHAISAVHTVMVGQKQEIDWVEKVDILQPMFTGKPGEKLIVELEAFFCMVSEKIKGQYTHIHIAIPDTAAWTGFYMLDSIPSDKEQIRALACWRIAKQFHLEEEKLFCDFQQVGEVNGQTILMVAAIERVWQELIQHCLQHAGLPAASIDLMINYQFQFLRNEEKSDGGVIINVTSEYWSLLIWDETGAPRFIRARWRESSLPCKPGDLMDFCSEIIRTLLIYCHQNMSDDVNKVFIVGSTDEERDHLVEHIQKQMADSITFPSAERIPNYSLSEVDLLVSAVLTN